MADASNRIGSPRTGAGSSMDLLRQLAGVGSGTSVAPTERVDITTDNTPSSYRRASAGSEFGPRGSRILPADFPMDQLDHRAARGTYVDILV